MDDDSKINCYLIQISCQIVDHIRVFADTEEKAKEAAVYEMQMTKGYDVVSGSYQILNVTEE
jgi:hypothetical protein